MKIAVLIRVFDRVEDLKYNLQIIADTWKGNDYYIIVISNGKKNGYEIPQDVAPLIDKLVVLENNAGHRKGNSQLLMEGAKYIPSDCDYTIILEADTWLYGDNVITKYTNLIAQSKSMVWASADWYDKYYALATDFAIVKTDYIRNNPRIFDFELVAECHVANFLRDTHVEFIWITENMPVHVPSYVFKYPYVHNDERRFYIFTGSKMVTHHIESLKKGMEQKKRYFNIVSGSDYFKNVDSGNKAWERFKINFWVKLSKCFLKRSWYSNKIYRTIEK